MWVPVTTAWHVLELQMKKTANKEWSSSLGVGQGANISPP